MALKFVLYKNGEIELVDKDGNGRIHKYIASWNNEREFKEALTDLEGILMTNEIEVIKKYNFEIQAWLEFPPKTVGRLRKFYESIVSIHLGGEGIMTQQSNERAKGTPYRELKTLFQNYRINHPECLQGVVKPKIDLVSSIEIVGEILEESLKEYKRLCESEIKIFGKTTYGSYKEYMLDSIRSGKYPELQEEGFL